jgi:hypothetical protein
MCELPFMLNLPNGPYQVPVDGASFELQMLNGLVAIHFDQGSYAVGAPQHLRTQVENYERFYRQPLRTVIRNEITHVVLDDQLPTVGDAELLEDLRVDMSRPAAFGQPPVAVTDADVSARLGDMPGDERERRRRNGAAMRYGRSRMRPAHEEFLAAINSLIRLYMERFGDTFVETIAIDHVAAMSPMHGVMRQIFVGGQLIDFSGIVGAIPPVMRGVWANYPEPQVTQFRTDLGAGVLPDSIKLLGVRAKELLKDATGQSAAAFDNTIWTRVGEHRKTHRQGASHSDAEPSSAEAGQVVNDFLWLADKVDGITLA